MSRSTMLIVLGVLTALTPFSGLPMKILAFILPILGVIALGIGISMQREQKALQRSKTVPSHETPVIPA